MKYISSLVLLSTLTLSSSIFAQDITDSLKGALGMDSESQSEDTTSSSEALSASGLLSSVTENLGVSEEQASGGLGAIFSYAKENVSAEKFSELGSAIPGLDSLLDAAPEVAEASADTEETGVGSMLSKASEYSDSLQSLNTLNQQFESLGLDADMVTKYVSQASEYLDTPTGQAAKEALMSAFSG